MGYTTEIFIGEDASGLIYAKLKYDTYEATYTSEGYKIDTTDATELTCMVNNTKHAISYSDYTFGSELYLTSQFSKSGKTTFDYTSFRYTQSPDSTDDATLECTAVYTYKNNNYPQVALKKEKNNTYYLQTKSSKLGTVTYNSSKNSFTAYSDVDQYTNFQNISIVANAGLCYYLINETTETENIVNAMFAMNASVYGKLK